MRKLLATYILLFIAVLSVQAVQTRFEMSAPNAVEVGKQFRLSFTINEQGTNLKLPDLSNFRVLMGPSTGQSTSISTINGRTTRETSYSYTYILQATEEGTFEIRPASIEVDGKIYESNSITIQVVKAQATTPPPGNTGANTPDSGDAQSVELGSDNLFVRVEMSKSSAYRGEQIIATVKLYANPNIPIAGFDEVNLPTYEGFFTQDIEIPQQINFTREVYDNKIYQVGVLKKTILFPQQNGKLTVDPFSLSLLVRQQVKQRSFFDDFFNNFRTVKASITSKPVTVNVKDLPPAPASFMGGVGNFSINAELSNHEATTNDAVTLKVTVSGNGNIRLIKTPELKLPSDFEVYDPRTTDNVNATNNGISGTKTIEYLFQPRFEGEYTIPAISFTYFNPSSGTYETKTTTPFTLSVTKGSQEQSATVISSMRKENVQLIGQDIRFIKQGKPLLQIKGHTFFGTTLFYALYAGSAILFLLLFFAYRKKVKENANIALVRNKKANKMATRRLKAAATFMKQNNNEAFHESILKAFEGYFSDKLGIPVAKLNRESTLDELQKRNVDPAIINDLNAVVDQCEFARYAPAGGSEARHELYKKAVATMSALEKQIKR